MKKTLLFAWYFLSFLLTALGVFLFNDEMISRKEILCLAVIIPASAASAIFSLKLSKRGSLKAALLTAGAAAFAVCFWTEKQHPLYVFFPDDPKITVNAVKAPVSLRWAYWAETPEDLQTNIYEWKGWKDIGDSMLQFSSGWEKQDNAFHCMGECMITFLPGLHLHQPILTFSSDAQVEIRSGTHPYDVTPGIVTPVFISGWDIPRQLIFAVLFTCLSGIFCCLLSFPFSLLKTRESSDCSGFLICISAFFLPLFILILICFLLGISPFGEKTFLISDMQCQYVDFLVHIRTLLREGRSLFYSFSKSLGDDYLSLFAYYLSNPLDWLVVFFPDNRIPEAVSLLVLLRFALCGLTSAVYFRKVFRTGSITLVFSTAYALMSLNFVIAEHTQLRSGAIILPLVFLGIEHLISHKNGLVYYLSLAAAMVLNYYSAFQICWFAVPYFFCRLFISEHGRCGKALFRFIMWSLLAAGTCAVLLIPVVLQLGGGMKTFDLSVFTAEPNFRIIELSGKLFNSAFDQTQTLTSGLPNLFCGVMAVISIPLFFLNRKISGKEKLSVLILLLACFLTMWINALNLIAHGFNEPVWWPYRYSFVISLLLQLPALRCFQEQDGNKAIHFFLCLIITGTLLVLLNRQNFSWFSPGSAILNMILCILLTGLLLIMKDTASPMPVLLFFVSLDLFLNGWMILQNKTAFDRSETVTSFTDFYQENLDLVKKIKSQDNDLYRMEKTYMHDANDAFLLDYNGISHFSSTLKYKIMQFLPAAGYRFYPTRFEYREGSTAAMDSLLGIRYLLTDENGTQKPYDSVFSSKSKTVYRNPYALPFGFMIRENPGIPADILAILNRFEFQNTIFTALSGNPDPVFSEPLIQEDSIDENSRTWVLRPLRSGTLYVFFDSAEEHLSDIEINGIKTAEYFDGNGHPILRLGDAEAGKDITVSLTSKDGTGNLLQLTAQFGVENPETLSAVAEKLKESGLEIDAHSDSHIQGRINAGTDGRLFLSIPFDKGWKLLIDGEETELQPAFGLFLSAGIQKGEHTVQLDYTPQGIKAGMCVSIFSAVVAVTIWFLERKRSSS